MQQDNQPEKQVGALDMGVAGKEIIGHQGLWRRLKPTFIVGRLVPQNSWRHHVGFMSHGAIEAPFEVIGLPGIIVVENGNEDGSRIVCVAGEPIDPGIPRAARSLGSVVLEVNYLTSGDIEIVHDISVSRPQASR
ncbi:MAG: hypothetical protein O7H41_21580 [Planctomycetota bacterium]|nr:hypothetical protein [Planctomycetota bacterium]